MTLSRIIKYGIGAVVIAAAIALPLIFIDAATPPGTSISSDGQFVVFDSSDDTLVAGDTNGVKDIFLYNTQSEVFTRISVDSNGDEGLYDSTDPSMSADGRYVAFVSLAPLVPEDDDVDFEESEDVYLYDAQAGTITLISVNSDEEKGDNQSFTPSLSSDGRYVAFSSYAANLVANDTNTVRDIFVRDTQAGTTIRVSVNSLGEEIGSTADTYYPAISGDGRYVVFYANLFATNLVDNDMNDVGDIFLHDTQTGTTTRVSVNSAGEESIGEPDEAQPAISGDGRYVAFQSISSNLVDNDTNGLLDIFLRDTQTGTTTRVSVNSNGEELDGSSILPSLSSDGQTIAFQSEATNLVTGDTNVSWDIFIKNLTDNTIVRASVGTSQEEADAGSTNVALSSDGTSVLFISDVSNGALDEFYVAPNIYFRGVPEPAEPASIMYGNNFTESVANDGSVTGTRVIVLSGDTFIVSDDFLIEGVHYTLGNVPDGLVGSIEVGPDGSIASLSFSGNAVDHENTNDVNNLAITFLDGAFTNTAVAADVSGYTDASGIIDFNDADPEDPAPATGSPQGGSYTYYACTDPAANNYESFGESNPALCTYGTSSASSSNPANPSSPATTTPVTTPGTGTGTTTPLNDTCAPNEIFIENMKRRDVDGRFGEYQGNIVTQIKLLQAHINKILAPEYGPEAAGPVDGIYDVLTARGVRRVQTFFNTSLMLNQPLVIDGIVGPRTRAALNAGCF